ncbi:21315_t:CDS:2, partial [Gigaspora rosea]
HIFNGLQRAEIIVCSSVHLPDILGIDIWYILEELFNVTTTRWALARF